MKIKVSGYSCPPHKMTLRHCKVCGRNFIAYNKLKNICSKECMKRYNCEFHKQKKQRLKNDPVALYYYRKATIDRREGKRKEKIRADLPNIKQALAEGDEALVDYIFDHYNCVKRTRRQYRRPQ